MYCRLRYRSSKSKPYPTTNLLGIWNPIYSHSTFTILASGFESKVHIWRDFGWRVPSRSLRWDSVRPVSRISSTTTTSRFSMLLSMSFLIWTTPELLVAPCQLLTCMNSSWHSRPSSQRVRERSLRKWTEPLRIPRRMIGWFDSGMLLLICSASSRVLSLISFSEMSSSSRIGWNKDTQVR